MEILSEQEMAARLDFRAPLHPKTDERESLWCIPFEWGSHAKGTRISIAKAKEIAAELRASVAEAEMRELRRHFERERERGDSLSRQLSDVQRALLQANGEIASLKRRGRTKKHAASPARAGRSTDNG